MPLDPTTRTVLEHLRTLIDLALAADTQQEARQLLIQVRADARREVDRTAPGPFGEHGLAGPPRIKVDAKVS